MDVTTYHIRDAARILSVHPRTLLRWAEIGKVRLIELPGRQHRITGDELRRLLENLAQPKLENAQPED